MQIPEIIPISVPPETQKNLTPAAVTRSEPPFHAPDRDGNRDEGKQKRHARRAEDADGDRNASDPGDVDPRGTRIDIRA